MAIGTITKAILGGATAASGAITTALQDGNIAAAEGITAAIAFIAAFTGVYFATNLSAGVLKYAKAITAGVLAGLGAVATALAGGGWPLSTDEWIVVATAALGGLGLVGVAPNAAASDSPPQG
jgi:hypothetical protein